jgi:hypothetical protein
MNATSRLKICVVAAVVEVQMRVDNQSNVFWLYSVFLKLRPERLIWLSLCGVEFFVYLWKFSDACSYENLLLTRYD